jgi:ADP-ribose pyrophosphatase YjhB (NUDIX family)
MFCSACGRPLLRLPPTECPACGTAHWNDAKPCASALVMTGSQLLMVRRAQEPWKGMWDVPGGFCEPGEHPIRTAQREVFEETGIRVRIVGFLGIWLDEYAEARGALKRTLNIYYHAVPSGPAAVAPDITEVLEAAFFAGSSLPVSLAFPGHVPAALAAWRLAVSAGGLVTDLFDGGFAV